MFDSRIHRHAVLALVSVGVLTAASVAGAPAAALDRISLTSAYLFLLLISMVLLLGPLRAMRTGKVIRNDASRRDVAIWSALIGLVHLIAGAVQSMTPAYLGAFIDGAASPPSSAVREIFFLWSTIAGFGVGILLVMLLTLSSNWSMNVLGLRWWKRLQRSSYVAFILTLLHGLGFQILESRSWLGYVLVGTIALMVGIGQVRGALAVRSRYKKGS